MPEMCSVLIAYLKLYQITAIPKYSNTDWVNAARGINGPQKKNKIDIFISRNRSCASDGEEEEEEIIFGNIKI